MVKLIARAIVLLALVGVPARAFAQLSIVVDSAPLLTPMTQGTTGDGTPLPDTMEQEFAFDTGFMSQERVMEAFNQLVAAFPPAGIDRAPDAARAKTILAGVDKIPRGLIQRLDTVGELIEGGSESTVTTCAVCWEKLLEDGLFTSQVPETNSEQTGATAGPPPGPTSDTQGEDDQESTPSEIVALPCRHLFHSSCLLPWLSRKTTCPSCRFNLDPEDLTWRPRRPRPVNLAHPLGATAREYLNASRNYESSYIL